MSELTKLQMYVLKDRYSQNEDTGSGVAHNNNDPWFHRTRVNQNSTNLSTTVRDFVCAL